MASPNPTRIAGAVACQETFGVEAWEALTATCRALVIEDVVSIMCDVPWDRVHLSQFKAAEKLSQMIGGTTQLQAYAVGLLAMECRSSDTEGKEDLRKLCRAMAARAPREDLD